VNEELVRLETLERHRMLTNASDQNALAELRKKSRKTPAKKVVVKKAVKKVAPVVSTTKKETPSGKAV